MANERLRAALQGAGLDPDQLARHAGVDVKTVNRWLAGRSTPHARHRSRVARALGVSEPELWPSEDGQEEDLRKELVGAWRPGDPQTPGVSALLRGARRRVDLLDYRLDQILAAPGTPGVLAEKASAGCRIRVLLPAPGSLWLAEAAYAAGRDEEDYVGRTELHRHVDLAIGYLQPLLEEPNLDARVSCSELSIAVIRADEDMLVALALAGAETVQRPVLHLRPRSTGGLFDHFAAHFDALHGGGFPLARDPLLYPDPHQTPQRYQPVTEQTYRGQLEWLNRELGNLNQPSGPASRRPGKLRRPRHPQT